MNDSTGPESSRTHSARYDVALDLYDRQMLDEATTILRSLADEGYPPAFYKLASYEFYNREQADALPWLALLEAAAARPDADACFRCFHAYRAGWAQIGLERSEPIGSRYLLRAAELGHVKAQLMLALELRSGANGQLKSEPLYRYWVEKAIEAGSEDAVYEHAKWLSDNLQPVPDSLMSDLAVVAQDWPNAARLLEKLKRRVRRQF